MLPATSKELVEARYGRPITEEEYEKELEYATIKLNFQAELFHKEFDVDYVTQVIMEIVNQNRLEELYREIYRLRREALDDKRRYEIMDALGITNLA